MSSRLRHRDRRAIAASIGNWVNVDEGSFSDSDVSIFRRRQEALNLYLKGFSLGKIRKMTQIKAKDLYRFLDRCEAQNSDGRPNGWRGIIPRERVVRTRNRQDHEHARLGHANQFQQFLINYPEIKRNLESLATSGKLVGERGPKRNLTVQKIKTELMTVCRAAGISVADYPLNVANNAYGAIRRFVAQLREVKFSKSAEVGGISLLPPVTRCYQRLEADGHWMDIICTVEFPSPTGRGVHYLPIERLWLIPVMEVQSTAALGYSIAYGGNYSGSDLIRAIRAATLPWIPLELTAKGLKYCPNGGFPNGLDEQLAFVCADEILFDNHKGHLSAYAMAQIHRTLGATPVYGPINNPNARACAEGFFSKLEEAVFHTLPSSTGSTSNNRDIKNPAANAVKYKITDQHIHEIAEVALAGYNSECPPGSSLTRVEILQRYVRDPRSLVRRIPPDEREQIRLYDLELELEIKGNPQNGIRPHAYFLESRYTNHVIASSVGLIGKKLRVYGYSGDIRTFDAYFQSGADAGTIICERRFRGTPHSLLTRKHANASRRTGGHQPNSMGDDIAGYRESLTAKAPRSKSAATELARLNAESREIVRRKKGLIMEERDEWENPSSTSAGLKAGEWTDELSKLGTQF